MTKNRRLSTKIAMIYGVSMTLLLAIMAGVTLLRVSDAMRNLNEELDLELAKARAGQIGQWLGAKMRIVEILARIDGWNVADPGSIRGKVQARADRIDPDFEIELFAFPDGTYVPTSGAEGNILDRDYFQAVMKEGKTDFVGKAVTSRSSGNFIVPMASAVKGPDGKTAALYGATVSLTTLSGIASDTKAWRKSGSVCCRRMPVRAVSSTPTACRKSSSSPASRTVRAGPSASPSRRARSSHRSGT